jgi:membrane protease YdiL (CAAX protease family)
MKRVLAFPITRILAATAFVGAGLIVGQLLLNLARSIFSVSSSATANLIALLLLTPLLLLAYRFYVRLIEARAATEIGLKRMPGELALGALTGLVLFSLTIGILWLLGAYSISGVNVAWLLLLGSASGAFVSALAQELIFRTILFRIAEEWLGTWWAVLISALLFGLIHLTQAGATLFSALGIALQAGVMLAAAYVLTGRLWMALGLHMAWDFANDGIFGVGAVGQTGQTLQGVLKAMLSGPDLLTGGAAGVEASLVTVIVATAAGFLLLWIAYRRGRILAPGRSPRTRIDSLSTAGSS